MDLVAGYQVLACRGFLVKESVAQERAELTKPVFKGRCDWITKEEVENLHIVFNVCIHEEIIISEIRRTFSIFEGKHQS